MNNTKNNVGKTMLFIAAFIIVAGVIAAAIIPRGDAQQVVQPQSNLGTTEGNTGNSAGDGAVQEVSLSMSGWQYIVEPSTLVAGRPVRMTVDLDTVTGCMRSIVIPTLGVRQTVQPGDNVIEFTPLTTGTIRMTCSMGMGQGSFEVVGDGSGSFEQAPANPAPQQAGGSPSGGSCGMAAGGAARGCGCGAR
jgi:uncharacterized protein